MGDLKQIVATQDVEQVDKAWGASYLSDAPYHVAYLTYVKMGTEEPLLDLTDLDVEKTPVSLSVKLAPMSEDDYSYTEDTIRDAVMDAYDDFPERAIPDDGENRNQVAIYRAGNDIARNTCRGVGKNFLDGFVIYKGNMDHEVPPTLWEVVKLFLLTLFRPDLRFHYTIARKRYRDRANYPKPNVDAGVIVSEAIINGVSRFALFKHPKFESYGFKLV